MLKTLNWTSSKEGAMEALGIFFAAITLGMLGLWMAAVQSQKSEWDTRVRTGDEPVEVKKTA